MVSQPRLEGVSALPSLGGSARSLIVRVDPGKLRSYSISPDDVVQVIDGTITISPSGAKTYLAPVNSTVARATDLNDVRIRTGPARLHTFAMSATREAADILTSYTLVDGNRAVLIAATKRADASAFESARRTGHLKIAPTPPRPR